MSYARMKPALLLQLAAPHTWPAAIVPVLLAACLHYRSVGSIDPVIVTLLLVICIMLQSAVNTLNDYIDFVKGADSRENQLDPTDAVLVYNNVNPKHALYFAITLIVAAFAIGGYLVYLSGIIPLIIAGIGAVTIVLYSGGKTPISYLPIGELVSGGVMGGLETLACVTVLSGGAFSWMPLLYAVPVIIGIGLIMMTNNTCDIEKDCEAQRKTLPVLLGRPKAKAVYRSLMVIWALLLPVLAGCMPTLLLVWIIVILLAYPTFTALWNNPLTLKTRIAAMQQCLSVNIVFGLGYCLLLVL